MGMLNVEKPSRSSKRTGSSHGNFPILFHTLPVPEICLISSLRSLSCHYENILILSTMTYLNTWATMFPRDHILARAPSNSEIM